MKKLLFLPAILWATCCFSQRQNVYFLKNNGNYVSQRDSADYIRIVNEPDSASSLYNVMEFYSNGKRKLIGKSITANPPLYQGQCLEYYANGAAKSLTNYKTGSRFGLEYDFYENGKPYLTAEYPEGGIRDGIFTDYLIKTNYDSLGSVQVENGNGYAKIYDSDFKFIVEEGSVKDGKRDGTWKGSNKTLTLSFKEDFQNGQLISGTAISADGTITTYTKSRGLPPMFKGGIEGFSKYLSGSIHYPSYEREHNIQGRVIISFVVEKDGKTVDAKVVKSVSLGLDQEAMRVINNSPRWVPGTMFGKPVRIMYSVPISFSLN